ncbi:unnamed protein product [Gongylonema pulchrum]|uniref:SCP domain-containing protein n=1 Tax=Gongylonema pulchrum TaxID=637853 RepID=A0A183ELT3_9BILA|nr:unnamed protein product [Gongylonema pulchrum]
MAWAETNQLGCAVHKCPDMVIVVCEYYPPGNTLNRKIYETAQTGQAPPRQQPPRQQPPPQMQQRQGPPQHMPQMRQRQPMPQQQQMHPQPEVVYVTRRRN